MFKAPIGGVRQLMHGFKSYRPLSLCVGFITPPQEIPHPSVGVVSFGMPRLLGLKQLFQTFDIHPEVYQVGMKQLDPFSQVRELS